METNNLFKSIKENWMIISFIVGFVISWTTVTQRLNEVEKDIERLQSLESSINTIQLDVAIIKEQIIQLNKIR
jgi:hypothetical protein